MLECERRLLSIFDFQILQIGIMRSKAFFIFTCIVYMSIGPSLSILAASTYDTSGKKKITPSKTEVFNAGFIDMASNGQVGASARLVKLMVGEPAKFGIPFSVYGGVTNAAFAQNALNSSFKSNEHLVTQFITPLSGLLNFSVDGILFRRTPQKVTRAGLLYQLGERVLTGIRTGAYSNSLTGKPYNFLNTYAVTGLYVQTGAWEKNKPSNLGICWMALRYHWCYTNPKQLNQFMSTLQTNGFYKGFSLGFGIDINAVVNIKAIYYRYDKAPEMNYGLPIYQFSFNYAMNGKY